MDISKDIQTAYFNAVFNGSAYFDPQGLKDFKDKYPCEFKQLNSFYRARTKITQCVEVMSLFGAVYWFTLTFDNEKDKNKESSKRRSSQNFLNETFIAYLIVEEYGEESGRYHIHGFGIFKDGKSFEDFRQWDCRQNIKAITEKNMKKKIRYLTDYTSKQLPRIRCNKNLVYLMKKYKDRKSLKTYGFNECFECSLHLAMAYVRLYNDYATPKQ